MDIIKAQTTKLNTDKLDFIKIKNFYISKDTSQPIKWEKIFANRVFGKELIHSINNFNNSTTKSQMI